MGLNDLLQELGISKVKLAKYLGVSRQMIYNYLDINDINKWPKDKKMKLFNLLNIKESEDLETIKMDTEYINKVDSVLNGEELKEPITHYESIEFKELKPRERDLLNDIIFLIKEKLIDNNKDSYTSIKYVYNFLLGLDSINEVKYTLGYYNKILGAIKPNEYAFNEEEQFIFESIMYHALILYHNGGASKTKLNDVHNKFVAEIEQKQEEKLSRTQEVYTVQIQALKELGYDKITKENASEVGAKIAEIQIKNNSI